MHQPDPFRFLGADHPARQQQLQRPTLPDQPHQPACAAPAGGQCIIDLREAKPRVCSRNPQVAGADDLAPAANSITVDGRNHGQRQPGQAGQRPAHRPAQPCTGVFLRMAHQFLEIASRHKGFLARAGNDEHPQLRQPGALVNNLGKSLLRLPVQRIHGRQAIDAENAD